MVARCPILHSEAHRRPRGRGPRFAILVAAAVAGLLPAPSRAAIINVPANQPTPQAAVAAAANGDTVLFAPGTYLGGVWVDGKALVLASRFLTTGDTAYIAQTVLDTVITNACGGASGCAGDAVVEFGSGAGGSAVIGLTVRRGKDGIRSHARVDISYCHCIQNEDGADYQVGGRGTFSNSLFAYSTDDGIDLNSAIELTITNCTITENSDDGIEFRLYPYVGPLLRLDVVGNRFIHNDSDGIQLIDSPDSSSRLIRIERNLFLNNRKATVGCMPDQRTDEDFSAAPLAEKVQFVNNTVVGDGYGLSGGANLVAVNNVFTNVINKVFRKVVGPNSIAAHNLVWNNGATNDSSNVDAGTTISANPLLAADYHLTAGSPAIDAGVASYLWRGEDVVNLPPGSYRGSAPDIGAHEFNSDAPIARRDTLTVLEGNALHGAAPGVLANDTDPNGDPLSVSAVSSLPAHGGLVVNGDGSYDYVHDGSEAPRDSFTYRVSDGTGNSSNAVVTIVVLPVNDPPTAVFDTFIVDLNSAGTNLDVLRNDTDPDAGDTRSIVAVNLAGAAGAAVIQNGAIVYTPPSGYTGFDLFAYTIQDAAGATSAAQVSVRVADVTVGGFSVRVSAPTDDAEEQPSGLVSTTSGDLELIHDAYDQIVGMRWPNLAIPAGAIVTSAWIDFVARESQSEVTNLTLRGQADDNPLTFATTAFDVSSRPRTTAGAAWAPAPWTADGAGAAQRTPDLSAVIQEIVSRPDWASGNALALIATGTGHRTAWSQNGSSAKSPLLHVEFVANVPALPVAVGDGPPGDLALLGVSPNPARGPLHLEFALASAGPAMLELLDVAGRRMASRDLGSLKAGRHRVELRELLPAGLYLVRLSQGGRSLSAKAVVVR